MPELDGARPFEWLARLGQTVSASLDLPEILEIIARATLDLLPNARAGIWVAEGDRLYLCADAGTPGLADSGQPAELAFGEGLTGQVARTREQVIVQEAAGDSFIGIPLVVKDRLVGVLSLATLRPHAFTPREVEVLVAFGGQAALAIENARLYAGLGARVRRLQTMTRLNQLISSTLDPQGVLREIAGAAAKLTEAAVAAFWRADDEARAVHLIAYSDPVMGDFPVRTMRYDHGVLGWVAMHRQAANVPDVFADSRFVPFEWWRTQGLRSLLCVPVALDGTLLALLALIGRAPFRLEPEDQELLDSFVAQAAVAIRNARLFDDSERRRHLAEALETIGRDLARSLDPAVVSRRILESLATLLGAHTPVLFRIDPESRNLVAAAMAHDLERVLGPDLVVPRGMGTAGRAVEERRPVTTPNILTDPRIPLTPALRARLEQIPYRAMLSVPLIVKDRVIGALAVTAESGRVFDHRQISLVQAFADQAALALDNADLLHQTRVRQARLEALLDMTRQLSSIQPLESLLESIAGACGKLLGSDAVWLHLAEGEQLVVAGTWGDAGEAIPTGPIEAGEGLIGRVAATGRSLIVANLPDHPALPDAQREAARRFGHRAWLGVPVKMGDRVAGVLSIRTKREPGFAEADVAVATAFASQAAVALENGRLFAREQAAQRFFQSTLDALSAHIAVLDDSGIIVAVNQAWRRFAESNGLQATDGGLGLNYLAICEGASGPGAAEALTVAEAFREVAAGTRGEFRLEYTCHSAREQRWFLLRMTRFDDAGRGRVVIAHEDVTERRLAEEALRRSEEDVRQVQKMEAIGRLAGGVAHDFNNLLTVIMGRSQMLLRQVHDADPVRRDLALIAKTAERAAALTGQLLAFSRKQVLQPKVVSAADVVHGLAPMLWRLLGEDIELLITPGLGPSTVKADPNQLEQVIVNLAVNGRDAMPRGGRLAIQISSADMDEAAAGQHGGSPGRFVVLAVSDSGTGIDAESLPRIFEPFFTTKAAGHGTGLGLATVYGIVKQHQGFITVDSEPGRGTTFRVYLPFCAEPIATVAVERPAGPTGPETVLLVEDEEEVRLLARDILQQLGYTVLQASNGYEAAEIGREPGRTIDLLLTDVIMPGMSGRELAERLRPTQPQMRVLYISGYTADALEPRALLDADLLVCQKPFTAESLAQRVREALDATPLTPRAE